MRHSKDLRVSLAFDFGVKCASAKMLLSKASAAQRLRQGVPCGESADAGATRSQGCGGCAGSGAVRRLQVVARRRSQVRALHYYSHPIR